MPGERIDPEAWRYATELDRLRRSRRPLSTEGLCISGLGVVEDERHLLRALIDILPDYLFIKDAQGRFLLANKAVAASVDLRNPQDMIGLTNDELSPPDMADSFRQDDLFILRTGEPLYDREERGIDNDGKLCWLSTTKLPLRDEAGRIVGIVGTCRDITARKRADERRMQERAILELIAMNTPLEDVLLRLIGMIEGQSEGITASVLLMDPDGRNLRPGVAPSLPPLACAAASCVPVGEGMGSCGTAAFRKEAVLVSDIEADPLWEPCREVALRCGLRACWSMPIISHEGKVLGTFAIYCDRARSPTAEEMELFEGAVRIAGIAIAARDAEARIHHMAHHDALTGLPNRTLLKDRLTQAIHYAERHGGSVTVAFIDLDNFKLINDSLGHNSGDDLLKTVADRMLRCVRASDTVVRLGGDEFVIVLCDRVANPAALFSTLRRIQLSIAEPFETAGVTLQVTCSVGLASYPQDGRSGDALLMNADAAMYRAKELGRDNFQFYTPGLNDKLQERLALQEGLRTAIVRQEFVLHYQPQVDIRTGRIFGVEALVRWHHPRRGAVAPDEFIAAAEESGQIVAIGDWVLGTACRQNKAWQDMGLPAMVVSVNVSARQFRDKAYVDQVAQTLAESGLDPAFLELEFTESLLMKDIAQAVATMRDLSALGVKLAIDDFGTGYSNLSALKNFPLARLKLDKSLTDDVTRSERDRAIVGTVIALGHTLGMRVIAEGVETGEQLTVLRQEHCDEMQGYYFSRPIDAIAMEVMLRTPDAGL